MQICLQRDSTTLKGYIDFYFLKQWRICPVSHIQFVPSACVRSIHHISFYLLHSGVGRLPGLFCALQCGVRGQVAVEQVWVHANVMTGIQVWIRAGVGHRRRLVVHLWRVGLVEGGADGQWRGSHGQRLWGRSVFAAQRHVEVLVHGNAPVSSWRSSQVIQGIRLANHAHFPVQVLVQKVVGDIGRNWEGNQIVASYSLAWHKVEGSECENW